MERSDYLARLGRLESRFDGSVPQAALDLCRAGEAPRLHFRRAIARSAFFDRMARSAQRALCSRRGEREHPLPADFLSPMSADLRSARRNGIAWRALAERFRPAVNRE